MYKVLSMPCRNVEVSGLLDQALLTYAQPITLPPSDGLVFDDRLYPGLLIPDAPIGFNVNGPGDQRDIHPHPTVNIVESNNKIIDPTISTRELHKTRERRRKEDLHERCNDLYALITTGDDTLPYSGRISTHNTLKMAFLTLLHLEATLLYHKEKSCGSTRRLEDIKKEIMDQDPLPDMTDLDTRRQNVKRQRKSDRITKHKHYPVKHQKYEQIRREKIRCYYTALSNYLGRNVGESENAILNATFCRVQFYRSRIKEYTQPPAQPPMPPVET